MYIFSTVHPWMKSVEVFKEKETRISWFTKCRTSNSTDQAFELCIAGYDDFRIIYDQKHR